MDRTPAKTTTPISDPTVQPVSAFEMSLAQDDQIFNPPQSGVTLKAGDTCPRCQTANIDYDNMLNLSCPNCGYTLAGCFT